MEVDNITATCVANHIKAFHRQCAYDEKADFGEPCANCKYVENCHFAWFAKMKPFFEEADISICLCYPEHLSK